MPSDRCQIPILLYISYTVDTLLFSLPFSGAWYGAAFLTGEVVMRLDKFTIRNFKGLKEITLSMPRTDGDRAGSADFLSIVGPNNVGKSSIIEALYLAISGDASAVKDMFYGHDEQYPIEVELEFDSITDEDKELRGIRTHVHDNRYRVMKRWIRADSKPERQVWGQDYVFEMPDGKSRAQWVDYHPDWKSAIEEYENKATASKGSPEKFKCTAEQKAAIQRIAIERGMSVAQGRIGWNDVKRGKNDEWSPNPGGISANLTSALPEVIFVPAIRDTREEASVSQKKSTIREIVGLLFKRSLHMSGAVQQLRRALSEVGALFQDEGKHQIIKQLERDIAGYIKRLINVDVKLSFSTSDDEISADLVGRTSFLLKDGTGPFTKPEHQGHGVQRALILSLFQVLADQLAEDKKKAPKEEAEQSVLPRQKLVLLVEEPEIYLHPEMCRKMRDTLLRIARDGDAQVICTTHSPIFLDLADRHDGIVILSKKDGIVRHVQRIEDIFKTKMEEKDQQSNYHQKELLKEQKARLRMILNFDPTVNEIFFTDEVCLVEGETEIAALGMIAQKLVASSKIDETAILLAQRRLAIVNCRGKWTIPPFQQVLNAFGISYRVVHDSDDHHADESEEPLTDETSNYYTALKANDRIRELLQYPDKCLMIHNPHFEGHHLQRAKGWSKDKPWKATQAIHKLSELPPSLIQFFEFVLNRSLAQLQAPAGSTVDATGVRNWQAAPPPPRRNTRIHLRHVSVVKSHAKPCTATDVLGIAAGPGRIEGIDQALESITIQGSSPHFVARVLGNSMEDTLLNGEEIVLKKLNDIVLPAIFDDKQATAFEKFKQFVKPNGVYVLALNEGIEHGAYTIKRVICTESSNGGWVCRIVADNPEAAWGHRGEVVIRRTDRVHFAAELLGLAVPSERDVMQASEGSQADKAG